MSKNPYSKLLIFLLIMLSSLGAIFALSPFRSTADRLSQLSARVEALSRVTTDTIPKAGNARILSGIEIPIRQGFPFCETFIGFDPRPNAIWNVDWAPGQNNINALTGSSLQLTSLGGDENGYVFVDIPFSAAFGLKVSFEFSNYGGTGADGVSFFMFDGSISAADFDIGGTGGALGYTAVRATSNENNLISPGLKGAYLGIGFDELGNFGNSRTGKYGGFEDPNNLDALGNTPLFPHSVIIRGPVDGPPPTAPLTPFRDWDRINDSKNIPTTLTVPRYKSYQFIDGRIFDPASTGIATTSPPVSVASFLHPVDRFEIDTDSFSASCPDEGFRKVFIDLKPRTGGLPGYTIEVQMLVNVAGTIKLVNVFQGPIIYPFEAPELLKVGFAAATGLNTNYHNIRNVTVQVSDENNLEKPIVEPLTEEVCEEKVNTFELDVELRNDVANAFIRCLQLYYDPAEALAVVTASGISIPFPEAPLLPPTAYCPTGNCVDLLCRPERTSRPAYDDVTGDLAGQFEVFLVDEGGLEVPKVRFIPEPGYSGVTTMYYTATDNFGQVSDPKPITITINPNPEPIITTLDPLVWEQQEAANIKVLLNIEPVVVGDSYKWFKNGILIPSQSGNSYTATTAGDYTVEVTSNKGCIGLSAEAITIDIVTDLNPNFTNSPIRETCQELGKIIVTIDGIAVTGVDSNGNPGNEKWRIFTASGVLVVDWTFLSTGQNTINYSGLPAGDYIFQLGDEFRSGQLGSDGLPLYRHVLPFTILPIENPLQIASVLVEDELCFGEGGIITVEGAGGDGPATYVFSITNTSTSVSYTPTSGSGATAVFNDVPQGNYTIDLSSGTRCQVSDSRAVSGPSAPLSISLIDSDGTSCSVTTSAFATWEVMGGTPAYTFVRLTREGTPLPAPSLIQTAGVFAFTNLTTGTYILTVKDSNGCEISSPPIQLNDIPAPDFQVSDAVACEGDTVILQPTIVDLSNSIPVFTWKTPQGNVITNNTTIAGITYTLSDQDSNPSTPDQLSISGLSAGVFAYTLSISGDNTCNFPDLVATVTVSEYPPVADVVPTNLDCFEDNSGELAVLMDAGVDPTAFFYEIVGVRPVQDSPIFTALPAGIYQIRVTNKVTSCETIIDNVEITQPELLEILDLDFTNPSCSFPNGTISFTLTGGTPDYLVQVNGKPLTDYTNTVNGNAYFIEDLVPDTYTISVEDKMLCQAISPPVTLVNDDLDPLSTVDIAEEICFGKEVTFTPQIATPGAFTITWFKDAAAAIPVTTTATPDADGLTFQINSTDFSLTISGLQEGDFSYFYRVEGPQLCPDYIFEAKVSVFPELKVNLLPTNEICFGASDGSITVEATGANGNFEYSLNGAPFVTSTVFGSLSPGNYTVETRSSNGCSIVETTIIEGPATPISVNTPDILRANCGLPNGIIQNLTISGGWGSYQVEWRQGSVTGTIVPGNETGAVDLFPADYFLIVTDLNGCIEIFQFEVEESSDPVYAIVPPIESCARAPIAIRPIHIAPNPSLPPAAATEVRWYTGPGQTGLIQNGADPGNPAIQYSIDDTDWLNPELIIQGLPAGVYDFYFYVVCTGQEIKIDITAYDTPEVTLETNAIVCFGDANGKVKVLSGGIPSYTYSVNGGAPMNQAAFESMSLTAGTYSLAVATPAGCSQNLNFTIAGPTAPLASSPLTKIDPGCGAPNGKLNLTITGGWLPYTLDVLKDGVSLGLQSINQNTISLDGYRPGVYQIRITDKEGCSVITNTVTMVDGPTQILADSDEICVGSLASLVPTLDPVATGSTFQWFLDAAKTQPIVSSPTPAGDGRIYQINATTGELTIGNLPASITEFNYYVTASGSGVCPGFTGNGKVRVYSNPTATATILNEVCFDDGGTITINASGGSGTYTYSLNGGGFGTSNVFKVARGTYEVEIQTPQGCGFTLSNIEVTGPIAALEGSNIQLDSPSCALENGEIRFNVAGGYPPYTISYSKNSVNAGTLNVASPGIATIANLGEGSYLFQVVDAEGCVISLPSALTLVEIPTVITAPDQVICDGGTANLTPSLPQNILNPSYVWSFDGAGNNLITSGTANGVTFTVNPNGQMSVSGLAASATPYTYYIMATGPGICGLSPTPVRITVNPIPALRVSNPSVVCDPQGTVDLTDFIEGFNPNVYDYTVLSPSGSAMRLDEIDDVAVSGDYRVSSSFKGTGCFNQAQRIRVLISETELIANFQYEADLGGGVLIPNAEIQIQENVNFQDLSQGNVLIWDWDFGDGNSSSTQNPVHQYQNKGTYTVKLTTIDSIGCISIYEIVVQVLDDYIVMIPNAFTPTGAKNLTFKPYYRGIASMEFYIFNTWGELIYKATSMEDAGWDGTLNGKQTPNGNYVYKGRFTSRSGEVINKSGVFILIR